MLECGNLVARDAVGEPTLEGGRMGEKRRILRRVTGDRRKGERRVVQLPVETESRAAGERRKGERRVPPDRRVSEDK